MSHGPLPSAEREVLMPDAAVERCACGDRVKSACDEEWGPNCDLGNNPAHVRPAPAGTEAAVNKALGIVRAVPAPLCVEGEPVDPKLPRKLLDVACRIRTGETLFRDDDLVDAAAHALKAAMEARDVPAQVTAKPLEWDQDSGFQWTDKHHGFSIMEEPGDDLPFSAAWGEGDADQFATLDQAKAWCQEQIDAYFGKHAANVAHSIPPPRKRHPLLIMPIMPIEVTDSEIDAAFAGTNFGDAVPRKLLALSVLKKALHYHCGHTITEIMVSMGLTTPKGRVTERGRRFCYRELDCGWSG